MHTNRVPDPEDEEVDPVCPYTFDILFTLWRRIPYLNRVTVQ